MASLLDFHCVSDSRWQALLALRQIYPTYSPKRRALWLLNALNQISLRLRPVGFKLLTDFELNLLPTLKKSQTRAFLLHKMFQNERVYIFDFEPEDRMISVTKLARSKRSSQGLEREAKHLSDIAENTALSVPEVLKFSRWDEGALLQVSAAPKDFQIYDKTFPVPQNVLVAIKKLETLSELPAKELSFWQRMFGRITEPSLKALADNVSPEQRFAVGAAHGDLGSENIFTRGPSKNLEDFLVIDWEAYDSKAPELTDQVGLWLGQRHRSFKSMKKLNRAALAHAFLEDFKEKSGGIEAALLALTYLAYNGIDLAQSLIGDTGALKQTHDPA
ncbi:hypothetical protein PSE_1163 [Pseudovibrio sp. FO-BEG1]|uniref:hypothetical protein n=1 Tax=Pseudovibrio sp. (strain FO-BEG1) TaxID=911045 RepID=UPI000238CE2B|nr:hypothetical protein [Pseudovibrio sp. FO-BEG1]AEV35675.1 hypothetical protein PSE_1163 [Pseudovibrio sp. FO-BEG1]